jgi:hypothetical protein
MRAARARQRAGGHQRVDDRLVGIAHIALVVDDRLEARRPW